MRALTVGVFIMVNPIFNIAILGMNTRKVSTFTYFIKKHAHESFQVSTAELADACIVDFDEAEAVKLWHDGFFNNKPSIILSSADPDKTQSVWVKKPVSSADMLAAVGTLLKIVINNKEWAEKSTVTPISANKALSNGDKKTDAETSLEQPVNLIKKKTVGYQNDFNDSRSPNLSLSKEVIAECCGLQEDVDFNDPLFKKQATFDPSTSLLRPIQEAINLARDKNTHVEIEAMGEKQGFIIMPGGDKIYVDLNKPFIRHYGLVRKMYSAEEQKAPKITPVSISSAESAQRYPQHGCFMHSSCTVLWQVALWSSLGRLPNSVLPDKPVAIAAWPNFTRLTITPHAIGMASILIKNAISPLELARHMQIPQRYVFAFISTLASLGLLVDKPSVETDAELLPKRKSGGIFESILRSLKLN